MGVSVPEVVALGGTFDSSTDTPTGTQVFFTGTAAYLNNLSTVYADSSAYYTSYAADLHAQAGAMSDNADETQDIEVDAEQTGSGFAPIFGIYVSPTEGFDLGLRYEGKAAMTLTNKTVVDGSGLFPDGAETNADMPAMLGIGVGLKVMPSLRVVADYNYYFNENVNWDGRERFIENGIELGIGLDFAVSDALRLSAGYLDSKAGARDRYGTDLSHTFDTYTIGAGGRYYVNPNLYISLGVSSTVYDVIENNGVNYRGPFVGNETYDKSTLDFAIGIGFSR